MSTGDEMQRHPLLLADIGGTNLRLAVERTEAGPIEVFARLKTGDYASFEEAALPALRAAGLQPRAAAVCGAGPLVGGRIALTNGTWRIDPDRIAAALGLAGCLILNDLEALALGVATPGAVKLLAIGAARPAPGGVRLIVGIGTGFGVAALLEGPGGPVAFPSEAGQIGLGPTEEGERALWPHIEPVGGRISVESLLSGPGFARLSGALRRHHGLGREKRPPEAILEAALDRSDSAAAETLEIFARLLGRVTGDLALAFKATGGVILAGGFLAAIAERIDADAFRAAFEAKGPLSGLMASIPTSRVECDGAALAGLAAAARRWDSPR